MPFTFSFSAPLGFEPTQHVSTQAPGRSLNLPGMLSSQGLCINVPSTQNALSLQVSMVPPYSICASNQTPPLPLKFFSVTCFDFFIAVLPPTCSMWSCMFVYCLSPLQVTSTEQWQIISPAQYLALRKSSTNISGVFVELNHTPQRFVPIHSPPAMYRPQELESTQMYSQIHIVV